MASMSVPADPGGDDDVSELPWGLRLSDAEGIAAERLDGAAAGSLQEALAIASPRDAGNAGPQPADAIGAADRSFAFGPLVRRLEARTADVAPAPARRPPDAFSPMPMPPALDIGLALAAPADDVPQPALAAAEVAEDALPALRPVQIPPALDVSAAAAGESSPALAAAEVAEDALPALRRVQIPPAPDVFAAAAGESSPALAAAEVAEDALPAPSPMPIPPALDVAAPPVDGETPPAIAATQVADAGGQPALTPSEDWQGFAGEPRPAPASAPAPEPAVAQSMQPLTNALDAAVRLAADASVAADALENLKRLLEHKQQLENRLPHLAAGPAPVLVADNAEASASAPGVPDAPIPPPLPPLPLPLHAELDAGGSARALLLPPRRPRPPPERRGFDVRGFMAGFALSWAFGAVLYLFMTAG